LIIDMLGVTIGAPYRAINDEYAMM
jgi:hypothetical protein